MQVDIGLFKGLGLNFQIFGFWTHIAVGDARTFFHDIAELTGYGEFSTLKSSLSSDQVNTPHILNWTCISTNGSAEIPPTPMGVTLLSCFTLAFNRQSASFL
jgi:hypothetical protein